MAQYRTGRPPSVDSMNDRIYVRVNKEIQEKLDECSQKLNTSRSDVIRKGIEMVHDSLNE